MPSTRSRCPRSCRRATSAAGAGGALADVGGSASRTTLLNYAGPVSNDAVTLAFRGHIGANDALRTGTYSETLTLTLSTTEPWPSSPGPVPVRGGTRPGLRERREGQAASGVVQDRGDQRAVEGPGPPVRDHRDQLEIAVEAGSAGQTRGLGGPRQNDPRALHAEQRRRGDRRAP